jgi:hypothetical protein
MGTAVTRHLVLDSEAAAALLSGERRHRTRASVIAAISAANGYRVVPTAVRAEAGWDRTTPAAADANRLVEQDAPLDTGAADRAAQLRAAVPGAHVVDAAVAVAAERIGAAGREVVEILTSDVEDLTALATHLRVPVDITQL